MRDLIDALLFTADAHSDEEEGEDSSLSLLCISAVGEIRKLQSENAALLARAEKAEHELTEAKNSAKVWEDQALDRLIEWDDMRARAEKAEAAIEEAKRQEPVGYMHDVRGVDFIHADVKRMMDKFYEERGFHLPVDCQPIKTTEHYTIPVYAEPIPAAHAAEITEMRRVIDGVADRLGLVTENGNRLHDLSFWLDSPPISAAPASNLVEIDPIKNESPLSGNWHHGNGTLCCGTLNIAREDFDTGPSEAFMAKLFDWMCRSLNAAQKPPAVAAPAVVVPAVLEEWRAAAQNLIDAAGTGTCSPARCNYPMDCCKMDLIGAMDAMSALLQSTGEKS